MVVYNSTSASSSQYEEIIFDNSKISSNQIIALLFCSVVFYLSCKYTKRIYFHPLSHIPGPRLAAATHLYEAYYNIFHDGFAQRMVSMHTEYNSPVLRIGTNSVHIGDPCYYHTIYNSGTDYHKDPDLYRFLGVDGSILTITDPEEHKQYRNIVSPLFSKRTADDLAVVMSSVLEKASASIANQGREGKPTVIQRVYRAIAADMVSYLLFKRPLGLIDSEHDADFYHSFMLSIDRFTGITWPRLYYPILNWIINGFPTCIVDKLQPGLRGLQELFKGWLDETLRAHDTGKQNEGRSTYFDLMIESRRRKGEPLQPEQLFDDIINYLTAGMEATGYVLSFATFFLLRHPEARVKLERELFESKSSIQEFDHRKIMSLPYLTAVVKESLRLSNTVPGFLPRVVPQAGVDIAGYHIPGGTKISMVHPVVELNDKIFPDPHEFIPERWLGDGSQDLEKWAIAFSKGRRQCIGKNLGYMMLYSSVAVFFSRFEMELYETTEADMEIIDQFAPIIKGTVKVKITQDRWKDFSN
ncbi:cytochrome P450 [Xylogone sp. PMI_703]|nr:cytochrome P450 [Xylogone sp. PMI_703]